MDLKLAICQMESTDDVVHNLGKIEKAISRSKADVYLFPELFLTRYGNVNHYVSGTSKFIDNIAGIARKNDIAVAVGTSLWTGTDLWNSLMFITPDQVAEYDKLYLANFPPYNEGIFTPGRRPAMVSWKGFTFGLLICYDAMFPEIHRYYAEHGADAVLMASASAEKSRKAMMTVLPARSLENTVYTAFCNNIGDGPAGRFFGGSALFSPLGEIVSQTGDCEITFIVELKKDEIKNARNIRHHLDDLRNDIDWS